MECRMYSFSPKASQPVKRLSILLFAAVIATSIGFSGCAGDIVSSDEVERTTSPGKDYQCVVFERNGGATTSFAYWIYLTRFESGMNSEKKKKQSLGTVKGVRIANLYEAAQNDKAYGVKVRWTNSRTIVIECLEAKVLELLTQVQLDGSEFKVILKKGISDPAAPQGSMLYNIQKSNAR